MSYELSFTESFFTGEEETEVTDRPTSILEAIENLSFDEKEEIARVVLKSVQPTRHAESECFAHDVLEVVRATNTCFDLRSPVTVYIDPEGYYTIDVYDKAE